MDTPKKRGRPPGVRNREVPPATKVKGDYIAADPDTIIARQLSMLNAVQGMLRNEIQAAVDADEWVDSRTVQSLEKMSNAIVRAIDALKKSTDLADELASRLTPEQLLDAALKKIEAQDVATLNYAIKRLRAHRERIAPVDGLSKIQMGEPSGPAVDAIAGLK